ncbi:MAG: SDR family oxidoreductase [Microthrixaceae bacterium]
MSGRFAGRTAVVTGAASGIGYEICTRLLDEGAEVVAGDLNPPDVPEGALGVAVDVSDPDQVGALIARCVETYGKIDILCNNAGVGGVTDVLNCTIEEWEKIFSVNVRGVFLGIRAALPHMLEAGGGVIVNTASVAASVGLPNRAAYCASKGAVVALTKQVAVQYAAQGIRCNCVSPGTVDSPWVGRLLDQADDPSQMRSDLIARQPLGRLGTPAEVAELVTYLASDQASFVTGADWLIDGGIAAG